MDNQSRGPTQAQVQAILGRELTDFQLQQAANHRRVFGHHARDAYLALTRAWAALRMIELNTQGGRESDHHRRSINAICLSVLPSDLLPEAEPPPPIADLVEAMRPEPGETESDVDPCPNLHDWMTDLFEGCTPRVICRQCGISALGVSTSCPGPPEVEIDDFDYGQLRAKAWGPHGRDTLPDVANAFREPPCTCPPGTCRCPAHGGGS